MAESNSPNKNSRDGSTARMAELRRNLLPLAIPQTVPSGILLTPSFLPPRLGGRPVAEAPGPIGRVTWRQMYAQLRKGAMTPAGMPDLTEVDHRAAKAGESGAIPIAIGHYRYHTTNPIFAARMRSEEHTSEFQSNSFISY